MTTAFAYWIQGWRPRVEPAEPVGYATLAHDMWQWQLSRAPDPADTLRQQRAAAINSPARRKKGRYRP